MLIAGFDDFDSISVNEAWDCDPFADVSAPDYDEGLDFDDDPSGDWQSVCLDRFGDRLINGRY